jgi:hypothetical protein
MGFDVNPCDATRVNVACEDYVKPSAICLKVGGSYPDTVGMTPRDGRPISLPPRPSALTRRELEAIAAGRALLLRAGQAAAALVLLA